MTHPDRPKPAQGGQSNTSASAQSNTSASAQSNTSASALALAGALSATVANFGVVIAVNSKDTATAGIFFVAVSIITILGTTSCLGTMTGLVYFMPQVTSDGIDNPRALLKLALVPVLAFGGFLAVVVALFAPTIGELVADSGAGDVSKMLGILALVIPAWGLSIVVFGATRALGSMTPTAIIDRLFRPMAQVLLMGIVAFTFEDPSPAAFAAAWGAPVIAATLAAVVALHKLGGFHNTGRSPISQREFWRFVRPRSASTALQIGLERIDVILVSALAPLAGLEAEIASGIYGSLSRFVTAANFLVASLTQAVTPKIRQAISRDNIRRAQQLVDQTTGWMVLLVWPYLLVLLTQPKPVLDLVASPDDAAAGAVALSILAAGILISPAAGPADGTLLMLGRSGWSLLGTGIAFLTDVALAFLLIPRLGISGAAIAWVAAVAVANGLPFGLAHYFGKFRPFPGKPAIIAGVAAIISVLPLGLLLPKTFAGLATTTFVGGLGILIALWVFSDELSIPLAKIPLLGARLARH